MYSAATCPATIDLLIAPTRLCATRRSHSAGIRVRCQSYASVSPVIEGRGVCRNSVGTDGWTQDCLSTKVAIAQASVAAGESGGLRDGEEPGTSDRAELRARSDFTVEADQLELGFHSMARSTPLNLVQPTIEPVVLIASAKP